jgi:NTE family protein
VACAPANWIDQRNYASFPSRATAVEGELWRGERSGDLGSDFRRVELDATAARTWGLHTINAHLLLQMVDQATAGSLERHTPGGFHQLSGYLSGQLTGNDVLLMRLTWYRQLQEARTLTRGFLIGGSFEVGNAWSDRQSVKLGDLRSGFTAFIGADTGIGPLYLGVTWAPRGVPAVVLFIGRP